MPGILDWYTALIGLMALSTLTMHGANYIAAKTTGPVNERSRRFGWFVWLATIVLSVLATLATFFVQPLVRESFTVRPWGVIFPLIGVGGLVVVGYFKRVKRDLATLLASGAFILGMLSSAAFSLYPYVLPAVNRANGLTVDNASGSQYGMTVGLVWWSIGIMLAAIYFIVTYRLFWGKVSVGDVGGH